MFQVKPSELYPNASNGTGVLDSQTKRLFVSLSVCMAVTALCSLFTNGIVFLAMIQSLAKDARRGVRAMGTNGGTSYITQLLLMSTTICGAIYSVFIMPMAVIEIVVQGKAIFNISFCYVRVYLDYMLCFVTNLHILFLATDTYVLIFKPLVYRQLTAKFGIFTVAIGWIIPSLLTILWRMLEKEDLEECSTTSTKHNFSSIANISTYFSFTFGIIFLLTLLYVWIVYFLVFYLIYQFHNRSLKKPRKNFGMSVNASGGEPHISEASLPEPEAKTPRGGAITKPPKFKTKMKSFRFIGLVLLSYTVGWLPIWIVYLIYDTTGIDLDFWMYKLLSWWTHCNFAINPVLYFLNKGIFRDVKKLLCGTARK